MLMKTPVALALTAILSPRINANPIPSNIARRARIGTLFNFAVKYLFVLKPEYRKKGASYYSDIKDFSAKYAVAPTKWHVHILEKQSLGVVGWEVSIPWCQDPSPFAEKYGDALRSFGPIPSNGEMESLSLKKYFDKQIAFGMDLQEDETPDNKDAGNDLNSDPTESEGDTTIQNLRPIDAKVVTRMWGMTPELGSLAQEPGSGMSVQNARGFAKYENAGKGTVVYVLDTGCDKSHYDLKDVKIIDWLYTSLIPTEEEGEDPSWSHGSATIGRIAGMTQGIAQDAEIVVARVNGDNLRFSGGDVLNAFMRVQEHITQNHKDKSGVVINVSWGYLVDSSHGHLNTAYREILKEVLGEILDIGNVVITTSAGNKEPPALVDTYPAALGPDFDKLVVVGGIHPVTGNRVKQTAPFVKISAPAVGIWIPMTPGYEMEARGWKDKFLYLAGTSFSCSIVTSLLSMWISVGVPVDEVVGYMESLAWERIPGGPKAVWTGIRLEQWDNYIMKPGNFVPLRKSPYKPEDIQMLDK